MKIEVTGTEELDDGELRLEIEYDQEFADLAIRKFILWSIEKQLVEETMTDPWADVREGINTDVPILPGMGVLAPAIELQRRLLADADAMLAVVRASQAFQAAMKVDFVVSLGARDAWLEAIAALPEHLK